VLPVGTTRRRSGRYTCSPIGAVARGADDALGIAERRSDMLTRESVINLAVLSRRAIAKVGSLVVGRILDTGGAVVAL
jgi:hypothetical protein